MSGFDFSLDVPESDVETESMAELAAFKARAKAEEDRYEEATSSEFFFCAVFRSQPDRDRVLAALGLEPVDGVLVDGYDLAERLRVEVERPSAPSRRARGVSKKLLGLGEIGGE